MIFDYCVGIYYELLIISNCSAINGSCMPVINYPFESLEIRSDLSELTSGVFWWAARFWGSRRVSLVPFKMFSSNLQVDECHYLRPFPIF